METNPSVISFEGEVYVRAEAVTLRAGALFVDIPATTALVKDAEIKRVVMA